MTFASNYKLCEDLNIRAKEAGFGVSHNCNYITLFTHGDENEFQSDRYGKEILLMFNCVEEALVFLRGINFNRTYESLEKNSYDEYPTLDYTV